MFRQEIRRRYRRDNDPIDPTNWRMKVLYILGGIEDAGTESFLSESFPFGVVPEVEPVVICWTDGEEEFRSLAKLRDLGMRLLPPPPFPSRVEEIRRMIRGEGVDLLHTTNFGSHLAALIAAARSGTPVLATLSDAIRAPWRLSHPNWGRLRTARSLTNHFHAPTPGVRNAAVKELGIPPQRITVIPRGHGPRPAGGTMELRWRARMALRLDVEDHVVVALEPPSGWRSLLRVGAELGRTRPRIRFLLADPEGSAKQELHHVLSQKGLGSHIRFLDRDELVPAVLAAADLFFVPALSESSGCSALDALALGLPIVAWDLPELRELLEEGGNALLVPPESSEMLESAISVLLDDPARADTMGRRSLEIFEERFTLEKSTARMIQLYRQIVEEKQGAEFSATGPPEPGG